MSRSLTDDIRDLMALGHSLETATDLAVEDRKICGHPKQKKLAGLYFTMLLSNPNH